MAFHQGRRGLVLLRGIARARQGRRGFHPADHRRRAGRRADPQPPTRGPGPRGVDGMAERRRWAARAVAGGELGGDGELEGIAAPFRRSASRGLR